MANNPYLEHTGSVTRISCKPVITDDETEAIWRERSGQGRYVKVKAASTNAAGHGLMEIEFLADDDTEALGRLENVQGEGSGFTASVETRGIDAFADGSETGALADADFGQTLKGAGDGQLKIAAGGFGQVIGGTKALLRISFDGIISIG